MMDDNRVHRVTARAAGLAFGASIRLVHLGEGFAMNYESTAP
ncbi:MAG: hypothetical protein R6U96_05885 [Promethearchaeia archaeon]